MDHFFSANGWLNQTISSLNTVLWSYILIVALSPVPFISLLRHEAFSSACFLR